MYAMFLVCAALGGTVFVYQFVSTLLGFGMDDVDMIDDLPDEFTADSPDFDSADGSFKDHGSTWFFGIISFRTVVAALAFFGLSGAASMSANLNAGISLVIAVATGAAAMYVVHWLMQLLQRLGHDGTERIAGAVGQTGTVYVPIPPSQEGMGKIQLNLQDRLIEVAAVTTSPVKLPTGARVEVTRLVNSTLLEVKPLIGAEASEKAEVKTA